MASPNFVMSGEICRAICEYKRDHPESNLTELRDWVSETHRQRLCISTISEILDLNLSSPAPSANFYFGDSSDPRTETGAEEEDADEDEECMSLSEDSEADTEVEDEEVEEDDDDDEEDGDEDEEMEDQDRALTLSDPDLLNCPVCTQPLTIPVYQDYASDECEWVGDWSETEAEEELYEYMEEEMEKMEEDESDDEVEVEVEEEEEMEEDGPLTISDPDLLDCPICMEPLSIPVHQCENGHVSCASCCLKVHNTCPSCSSKIGPNRCLFVEKLLESVTAPCKNKKYGCEEMLKYYNKHGHEKICQLTPCSCPVTGCSFKGTMAGLYSHFSCSHIFSTLIFNDEYTSVRLERSQRHLIFCGEDNSIFVLNKFNEDKGSVINVVQIAPFHSATLPYKIRAGYKEAMITLRSSIRNVLKWEHSRPERNFLFVPDYYASSEGQLHLHIRFLKAQESPANSPEVTKDVN